MKVMALLQTAVLRQRGVVGDQAGRVAEASDVDGPLAFGAHQNGQFDLLIADAEHSFFRHKYLPKGAKWMQRGHFAGLRETEKNTVKYRARASSLHAGLE